MNIDSSDVYSSSGLNRRNLLKALGASALFHIIDWPPGVARAQSILDSIMPPASARAYASHRSRAFDIALRFATEDDRGDLNFYVGKDADEDGTTALIAHCHILSIQPDFARPGSEKSATLVPKVLSSLKRGDSQLGTNGNYDPTIRNLLVLLHRYPSQIGVGAANLLTSLIPVDLVGGHSGDIEIVKVTTHAEDAVIVILTGPIGAKILGDKATVPETENHLLMIESSRFLVNELKHVTPGDQFDNESNGLKNWLLSFMATIAQHDFLEFNSRPYARYSLHALLNLHEFAKDGDVSLAAQHLLDYTMMKFALSSNRGRRVGPFRRQQYRINHDANSRDDLLSRDCDEVAGFFLAYIGMTGPSGVEIPHPSGLLYEGVLAGTAKYRPTPAAYILALDRTAPAAIHYFYHGVRPRLPASPEDAESGVEIYSYSPLFQIAAGGSFLNSGYGQDDVSLNTTIGPVKLNVKFGWEQTSRAQATTFIPTSYDLMFHDLLRFEPYPDPQVNPAAKADTDIDDKQMLMYHTSAVNIGVGKGLMAGANLRPDEKKTIFEHSSLGSQALTTHNDIPMVAWFEIGDSVTLKIGQMRVTTIMKLDGIEGIGDIASFEVLKDPRLLQLSNLWSNVAPALASFAGHVVFAWTNPITRKLAIGIYGHDEKALFAQTTLADTSDHSPTLVVHNNKLLLGWTGVGKGQLNVAQIAVLGGPSAADAKLSFGNKITLADSSDGAPALLSHNGRLFIGWQGTGENKLNLLFSEDDGVTFTGKSTYDETSTHGPSLTSHGGYIYMSWKGKGNQHLNIAKVVILGNTQGKTMIGDLENKIVSGEQSDVAPTICSYQDRLILAWSGVGEHLLNFRISRDGTFVPWSGWRILDHSENGFYVAVYRTPASPHENKQTALSNLGIVYAIEKSEMDRRGIDLAKFEQLIKSQNAHLPNPLQYGGTYAFLPPDGQKFTIWFQPEGDKYRARVVETSQYFQDYSQMPLVHGPYMDAPGGHDGLIEIRHPGCGNSPVVLDYRNTTNPVRNDNKAGCPGPWLERAKALSLEVKRLQDAGRIALAKFARAESDALKAEMASLTQQTVPTNSDAIGNTIRQLSAAGVDYSVTDKDIRDWLANPQYTPYPSIAEAILNAGWRIKTPVYIDVIVGFYEQTPNVKSPRKVEDVRMNILKQAILSASNERYTRSDRDFSSLLQR